MSQSNNSTTGAQEAYKIYVEARDKRIQDMIAHYSKPMKSAYIDDDDAYATYWAAVAAENKTTTKTETKTKTNTR